MNTHQGTGALAPDGTYEQLWQTSLAQRIGTGVGYLGIAVFVIVNAAVTDFPIIALLPVIVSLTVMWWTTVIRPSVRLISDELIVRNLRTHRIPRADVVSAEAQPLGVVIHRRVGRQLTALALRKGTFWRWPGRHQQADQAAAIITQWAHRGASS